MCHVIDNRKVLMILNRTRKHMHHIVSLRLFHVRYRIELVIQHCINYFDQYISSNKEIREYISCNYSITSISVTVAARKQYYSVIVSIFAIKIIINY